eukprot:COSAG05_NODE_1010_length_6207_cov_3.771447_3_plen_75_part_00
MCVLRVQLLLPEIAEGTATRSARRQFVKDNPGPELTYSQPKPLTSTNTVPAALPLLLFARAKVDWTGVFLCVSD